MPSREDLYMQQHIRRIQRQLMTSINHIGRNPAELGTLDITENPELTDVTLLERLPWTKDEDITLYQTDKGTFYVNIGGKEIECADKAHAYTILNAIVEGG